MTDDDIGADGRDYRGRNFCWEPPEDVATILAVIGVQLGLDQISAFSADLRKLKRTYTIQKAATAARAVVLRKINQVGGQARKLEAALSDAEVATRLKQELPAFGPNSMENLVPALAALIEAAEAQDKQIKETLAALKGGLDLGSTDGDLVKGLAKLATNHLGIKATMPGDPPAGPFVDFVREVYGTWGEPRPTGEAIKANFYPRSGVAAVAKTTTQTT